MLESLRESLGNWILPEGAKITKSYIPPSGAHIIRQFSTDDEPKLAEYPKGKYTAYWEIILGEVPGGHSAMVRFYGYQAGGHLEEKQFIQPDIMKLRADVSKHIRQTMPKYER